MFQMEDLQKNIFSKIMNNAPIDDYIKSHNYDINYYPRSNIYYLNTNQKYDFKITDYSWTLAEFWIITKKTVPPINILPTNLNAHHNFISDAKGKTKNLTLGLLYKLATGNKSKFLDSQTKKSCVLL